MVVAGNVEVRDEAAAILETTGRPTVLADNVLPQIGVIAPESARAAIRDAFLHHVIGGKGLSRDPAFAAMVEAATPDVVLRGVEVLASVTDGDVLVVDVGGATTDVYSCLTPAGEDATLRKDVVAPLWHARTVEGDLGLRWNSEHVIEAATAEHLLDTVADPVALTAYAAHVHERPGSLPVDDVERGHDLELARLAALVAVRRHARPAQPTESARPLADVRVLVGSGGVLRHTDATGRDHVLGAILADHAGGWKVPRAARATVDTAYLLSPQASSSSRTRPRQAPPRTPTSPARWPPKPSLNRRRATCGRLLTVERPRVVASEPSKGHVWPPPRGRVATRAAHPHLWNGSPSRPQAQRAPIGRARVSSIVPAWIPHRCPTT